MSGDIWRVPTVLGVMACAAMVLFAAGVVAWNIVRRKPSAGRAPSVIAGLGLLCALTVLAIRAEAARVARAIEIDVAYVDPGLLGYAAPILFAGFAFLAGRRILRDVWTGASALVFYLWFVVFTAANVVNWCSPGWCALIGFPFPWQSWSDGILTFGDPDEQRFWDVVGTIWTALKAVLDLAIFVAVAELLARGLRARPSA